MILNLPLIWHLWAHGPPELEYYDLQKCCGAKLACMLAPQVKTCGGGLRLPLPLVWHSIVTDMPFGYLDVYPYLKLFTIMQNLPKSHLLCRVDALNI